MIQNNNATIHSVSVDAAVDGTVVEFVLVSPDEHRMQVRVEYSEDRGASFNPATLDPGVLEDLETSSTGIQYQVTWDPRRDLVSLAQGDLQIRLVPRDLAIGVDGAASVSPVFALGANTPPQIHSITTPATTQGGSIEFDYTVSDPEGDAVALHLEYSLDSGSTWYDGSAGVTGNGIDTVPTTSGPVTRTVSWFAQADAPGTVGTTTRFRVAPEDVAIGNSVGTANFSVNLIAPTLTTLTVGDIPDEMNGTESYVDSAGTTVEFHLRVPSSGFRIDATYRAGVGGSSVDGSTVSLTTDQTFGSFAAGTDAGSLFSGDSTSASWTVPSSHALPPGMVTLTATVRDQYGNFSNSREITIEAINATAYDRPFEALDLWWLNFGSDLFAIDFTPGATVDVTTSAAPDGESDFLEDLRIVGLSTTTPTASAAAISSNEILFDLAADQVVGRLRELFGGDFDATQANFSPNLRFTRSSGGHRSVIRVGGDDAVSGFTLGRAHFDHRNASGNTNSSTSLGVFTTNMIQFYINSSSSFQSRFNSLIPGRGTPAGEHSLDHIVLAPGFDRLSGANTADENSRYDAIWTAIDAWGRSVAVVIAHEVGHSLGLCSNGPPPSGLFGGVQGPSWSGGFTNSYHFDSPGQNIMAAALSFSSSVVTGPNAYKFNEVNESYLREMILLDN